jgi:hypothetical protein
MGGVGLLAALNGASRRFGSLGRLPASAANVNAMSSEPVREARVTASGSSFYMAMRLMPPEQRQAMFEIYSFCRAVDDIADNSGPRDVHLAQLRRWRHDVDAIYAGATPPRLHALAEAIRTFNLRRDDFFDVIDGMEMDVIARSARPIGRRSISIATAWPARRVAYAFGCSKWRRRKAQPWCITSTAPSN